MAQPLQSLGSRLQAAVQDGDQQARERLLDLRELALAFRSDQNQVSNLLQALHGFVANEAQSQSQVALQQQGWGPGHPQSQPGHAAPQQQGGDMLGWPPQPWVQPCDRDGCWLRGSDDLINKIFWTDIGWRVRIRHSFVPSQVVVASASVHAPPPTAPERRDRSHLPKPKRRDRGIADRQCRAALR